jgi:hypothetical protein
MTARRLLGERGSGLYEFVVAVIVISTLGYFLLQAIDYLQEAAEKTTFEQTVANIEAGLRFEAASRLARGQNIRDLLEGNPMRWMRKLPTGYLGELPGRLSDAKKRGVWYYDKAVGQLVYVLSKSDRFHAEKAVGAEIRLRIVRGPESAMDLKLQAARPYTWL